MSNKLKSSRKRKESYREAFQDFFGQLLNGMISVYMFLIIVVMPFYNQEGFLHIGSDKASFFRNVSVSGAKFILPTLVIFLVLKGVELCKEKKPNAIQVWDMLRKSLTTTDKFALVYGLSLILSYLCTDYKDHAAWGADGWYMGFWPQMILLGIYFLVSKCWNVSKWMAALFLPVSAVVFGLGYLNRFGIFPIDMKVRNNDFLSTVGNLNWYCGYLVAVFFGGVYLLWQSNAFVKLDKHNKTEIISRGLLIFYAVIGFATLVTQGSQSGIFALAVVLVVMFCMSAGDGLRMQMFCLMALILATVCMGVYCHRNVFGGEITFNDEIVNLLTDSMFPVVGAIIAMLMLYGVVYSNERGLYPAEKSRVVIRWMILVAASVIGVVVILITINTAIPGSIGPLSDHPFFTFSESWGSGRGATWQAGWMCFAEQDFLHKMIGTGPDSMSVFLYRNGSVELVEMVQKQFGTNTLTNAHCEWLTILVNEGVLGFIGFVGMMCSAIVRFLKCGKNHGQLQGKANQWHALICGACGLCVLAYTANNVFSFQQSMNTATIFVVLGIGEAYARK